MPGLRLILLVVGITMLFSVLSLLLLLLVKKRRLWILPPVALLLTAAVCFIKSRWFAQGFEDIGYLLLSIVTAASGILSFVITWLVAALRQRK
jgi:hypothetical protein